MIGNCGASTECISAIQPSATLRYVLATAALVVSLGTASGQPQLANSSSTPSQTRRSQRVHMDRVEVASPDGKVKFTLLPNAERLTYVVSFDNAAVLEPSPIIMRLDGFDLSSGVALGNVDRFEVNETYPWFGAHATATNRCHGIRIALEHDLSQTSYTLEVRAFDDGVAFRHIIPGDARTVRVPDEYSTFVVPAGATVWYGGLEGHYEATYTEKDITALQPGEWCGPPLTFTLPGLAGFAAITEANLVNYSGMALEADGRRGWTIALGHRQPLNYPFELRYGRAEAKRLAQPAAVTGDVTTPWRVVMVGRDLDALVNSTILPNLCPPPDPRLFPKGLATPWIRPGRAVWRYLDGGPDGVEGMKEFARLAGELGFEHHIIEGVWSRWTTEQRKEIVDNSRRHGVGVWFWKHSRSLRTPEAREEFFAMLEQLGVAGAKIDFFDHEHKELVDLYEALLAKAAEHHILIVFHGANKPTGRERTWPNELAREAVKGMESSRLADRARHQVILPFTRYLAGPADYTTMIFSARRGDTTWANQIASDVILNSPLQTIAANPQTILTNPAVDLIKSIPSVWDATIVLPQSQIGKLAAFARRRGDEWFLAIMNGPDQTAVDIPLSFLPAGEYESTEVRDGNANRASVKVEHAAVRRTDRIQVRLAGGGGFVARFQKR